MAFTYDLATNTGKVRVLIPDRVATQYFFEDEELAVLFAMQSGSSDTVKILKTTAVALETMASDEAYVQKAIKLLDLTTNGPATAEALLKRARLLREQAAVEEADATTVAEFDWAEWVVDDFSGRERMDKEALRDV